MRAPLTPLDDFVSQGIELTFECGPSVADRSVEVLEEIRRDTTRHAAVCIGFSLAESHQSGELWLPVLRGITQAGLSQGSPAAPDETYGLRSEGLSFVDMFDEYSERPIRVVEQSGPIICDDYELRMGNIFSMISKIQTGEEDPDSETETPSCKLEKVIREARNTGEEHVKQLIGKFSPKS